MAKAAKPKITANQRKQMINELIEYSGVWEEADRETLTGMGPQKLTAVYNQAVLAQQAIQNAEQAEMEESEVPEQTNNTENEPVKVLNQNQPPQTLEQWLATVPPEARGIVQNALNAQQRQKEDLITQITNNANNQFTKEFLQTQPVEVLTGLARLAGTTQPHYAGAGVLNPTNNRNEEDLEDLDPLLPPTLNFESQASPGLMKAMAQQA